MTPYGFDERWQEIRAIHKEYRVFYQISGGLFLLIVGILIDAGMSRAEITGNTIIGVLVGAVTAIVTNLASWWILFHGIVPNIHFSTSVSKITTDATEDDRSGYRYRFKLKNMGRRAVVDVEVMARLRIKGLISKGSWHVVYIPLDSDGNTSWRIPRLSPAVKRDTGTILWFWPNSADEFSKRPFYPPEVRNKAVEKSLLLEDVLNLGSEATLEVVVFGYDEFSGTGKLFLSKRYTIYDIREGRFEGLDVPGKPSVVLADRELDQDLSKEE